MAQNRLAELIADAGFKQNAFAHRIGVDPSTVSRWAAGITMIPDGKKEELAERFGVSVSFLMGWDEDE